MALSSLSFFENIDDINFFKGILGLWTGLNPLRANLRILDSINLIGEWECVGSNIPLWLGIEFTFIVCDIRLLPSLSLPLSLSLDL
jgi:hypothetical protein